MKYIAIALILLLAAPAHADPCREAVNIISDDVAKGVPVPCEGTLVPAGEARRALKCLADAPVAVAELAAVNMELAGEKMSAVADAVACAAARAAVGPAVDPPRRLDWFLIGSGTTIAVLAAIVAGAVIYAP